MWRIKNKLNALKVNQKGDISMAAKISGVITGIFGIYLILQFQNALQNILNPLIDNQAQAAAIRILYGLIVLVFLIALILWIFSPKSNDGTYYPPQY